MNLEINQSGHWMVTNYLGFCGEDVSLMALIFPGMCL